MIVRFLGDIHGNLDSTQHFTSNTIQLGDYNLFGYDVMYRNIDGIHKSYAFTPSHPIFFIDGNHDNFPLLNPDATEIQQVHTNVYYIPRGYVSGKTLFLGGADSIDKHYRTPGFDWFPEESFNVQQQRRILSMVQDIDVIVSHETPLFVANKIVNCACMSSSQMFFNEVFEHFKPKLWIFGHYHVSSDLQIRNCRFICLNTNEYMEKDIPIEKDFFNMKKSS